MKPTHSWTELFKKKDDREGDLSEYYKDYDTPEYKGYLNAAIFVLELNRAKLHHTPKEEIQVAKIDRELKYLKKIRGDDKT